MVVRFLFFFLTAIGCKSVLVDDKNKPNLVMNNDRTCHITITAEDHMPQNISTITLDDYLNGKTRPDIIPTHLLIYYTRVPITVYTDFYKDLYPNAQEILRIQQKVLDFPGKRVLLIHDTHDYTFLHGYYSLYDCITDWKIDYVISNYCGNDEFEVLRAGLQRLHVPIATIPNLVSGTIFKNRHLPKKYDVMIYGSTSGVYALRKRMFDLLTTNRLGWRVKVLAERDVQGEALSTLINEAHLVVSTGSLFDYLVAKYFEIGHSHACLLGNVPVQGRYLFEENYIPLNLTMSYEEIEETISSALERKPHLAHLAEKVSQSLQLYVAENQELFMKKTLHLLALKKELMKKL
jgi:hypothetical protein